MLYHSSKNGISGRCDRPLDAGWSDRGYLLIKVISDGEAPLTAMLIGAMLAGVATVALVGFVTRFSRVKQDTAIGIMYTGIFALGSFVISLKYFASMIHIDIYHYIVGSVLTVPDEELWLLAIVTSIVLSVVILFYRPLQLTSFDPIMAASIGIPVLAVEYLLTVCTSLVVVSGVQIAGVILVVALIITPRNRLLANRSLGSNDLVRDGIFGFRILDGICDRHLVGASPGPSVVVMMTLLFIVALVFAPRYGLGCRLGSPQEIGSARADGRHPWRGTASGNLNGSDQCRRSVSHLAQYENPTSN